MMLRIICFLAMLALISAKSVSMSTDTVVNGIDGLNVKWEVPFKVDDYVVGFKYSLSELKKAPQTLFAKRTFALGESEATVNADFDVREKTLQVASSWVSNQVGLAVNALADSKEMLKNVGASTTRSLGDFTLDLAGKYDMMKKTTNFQGQLSKDDTTARVNYNTDDRDVILSVAHQLDSRNSVEPSISLTSGDVTYGWTRKWEGGQVKSTYHPGDRADIEWRDNGVNGRWTTKASVPLENTANTKISFSRDWDY